MAVIELSCLVSLRGLLELDPIVQPTERLNNNHTIVHWESISEATGEERYKTHTNHLAVFHIVGETVRYMLLVQYLRN